MMKLFSLGLLVAMTSACAARSPAGESIVPASDSSSPSVAPQGDASPAVAAATDASAPKRKSSGPITEEELSHASVANMDAYSVVQRLRPSFLTSRGAVSLRGGGGGVLVSIDRAPPTGLAALRSMKAAEVEEISYLSASEAGQKFGTSARNSAVLIVTRR